MIQSIWWACVCIYLYLKRHTTPLPSQEGRSRSISRKAGESGATNGA